MPDKTLRNDKERKEENHGKTMRTNCPSVMAIPLRRGLQHNKKGLLLGCARLLRLRFAVETRKTQLLRVGLLLECLVLANEPPQTLAISAGVFFKIWPRDAVGSMSQIRKVDSFEARCLRSIFGQA